MTVSLWNRSIPIGTSTFQREFMNVATLPREPILRPRENPMGIRKHLKVLASAPEIIEFKIQIYC